MHDKEIKEIGKSLTHSMIDPPVNISSYCTCTCDRWINLNESATRLTTFSQRRPISFFFVTKTWPDLFFIIFVLSGHQSCHKYKNEMNSL